MTNTPEIKWNRASSNAHVAGRAIRIDHSSGDIDIEGLNDYLNSDQARELGAALLQAANLAEGKPAIDSTNPADIYHVGREVGVVDLAKLPAGTVVRDSDNCDPRNWKIREEYASLASVDGLKWYEAKTPFGRMEEFGPFTITYLPGGQE